MANNKKNKNVKEKEVKKTVVTEEKVTVETPLDNVNETIEVPETPSIEEMKEELIHEIEENETVKECNEVVGKMEENLQKINDTLLTDKEEAERLINEEINKAKEALEKINTEIEKTNIEACSEEATQKLIDYFKRNNFSQFWNGVSSGWDN